VRLGATAEQWAANAERISESIRIEWR
jgi:hypothetical protein